MLIIIVIIAWFLKKLARSSADYTKEFYSEVYAICKVFVTRYIFMEQFYYRVKNGKLLNLNF